MKEELIQRAYELAKERYAAIGVDVEKAMDALQKISLSLHCWQADDVAGFEAQGKARCGQYIAYGAGYLKAFKA